MTHAVEGPWESAKGKTLRGQVYIETVAGAFLI
ncbi:MAG: hypothetical protein RL648_613 [Verrucomicrobiota bacterium]